MYSKVQSGRRLPAIAASVNFFPAIISAIQLKIWHQLVSEWDEVFFIDYKQAEVDPGLLNTCSKRSYA